MSHARYNGTKASKVVETQTPESADPEWLDELFQLLGNSRRRHAIQIMLEHERIDHGELVWQVAEREYQLPRDDISSDERHTIYVSLTQSHLPRLEKAGIIDRERDTGSVGLGPEASELEPHLELVYADDSPEGVGDMIKKSLPF